jgi:hypothetical protein
MNSRPGCCPCTSPNPRKGTALCPFLTGILKGLGALRNSKKLCSTDARISSSQAISTVTTTQNPRPKSHNSRPQASNFALHNTAESVTYYTTHRGNVQRRKTMPCSAPSKQSRQPHADHAARHFPPGHALVVSATWDATPSSDLITGTWTCLYRKLFALREQFRFQFRAEFSRQLEVRPVENVECSTSDLQSLAKPAEPSTRASCNSGSG